MFREKAVYIKFYRNKIPKLRVTGSIPVRRTNKIINGHMFLCSIMSVLGGKN